MQIAIVIPLSEIGNLPGIGNQLPSGPPPHPGHGLPGGGQIDNTLPAPPIAHLPPQAGQLPIYPATPGHDLPPPGIIYPPLPPSAGVSGKALAVVYISGVGSRWTVIDTSLSVGGGPATPPQYPTGQPVPPTATPQTRY